jgi:hypothetical protein
MKRSLKWVVLAGGTACVLAAGFIGGRAWAGGIPTKGALTYSGVLQKVDGSPLTTAGHNLEIKLWSTGPTGGTALCDTAVPAPTFTLDNSGRFSVQLDDTCTGAIGVNPGAWVEILLDGNTLNRTKLGAVPYAIEANHAVSADTATNAGGALKTSIDAIQTQLGGLTKGCTGKAALQSVPASGTPVCAAADDIVAISATVTGAIGGQGTANCPSGYTLVAAGLVNDQRTQGGNPATGWNNGGVVSCTISGNMLIANLGQYTTGSAQTIITCQGICVR